MLDIWDYKQKDKMLNSRKYFMKDITKIDLGYKEGEGNGLSRTERQWLQIQKSINDEKTPFIDKEGLNEEISNWKYPLHFIDFETSAVALPFYKNLRPYEGIAFQFSHHIAYEDGTYEHIGEYLNDKQGVFPNFEFIRELKKQLEIDNGSVFRYAAHENTYLNMIYSQLRKSSEPDRKELCEWIQTISHSTGKSSDKWVGARDMIDLLDVVKRYYYHPMMKGSNSIKKVLPAILFSSEYLQEKYSKPIYGNQIKSLNFKDWTCVKYDANGMIQDPYKLLPPVFDGLENELLDIFVTNDKIADGGAAMMAYAKMQFTEMSDLERELIKKSLLKYCELDTFAMVMIWEGFGENN